jgi:hypothetical protein
MSKFKGTGFEDRLSTAANAKKAELEKFRAKSGPTDPAFVERQTARHAIDVARDARIADARETAQKATRDAEVTEQAARDVGLGAALQAERKAARDARYAARKARPRK